VRGLCEMASSASGSGSVVSACSDAVGAGVAAGQGCILAFRGAHVRALPGYLRYLPAECEFQCEFRGAFQRFVLLGPTWLAFHKLDADSPRVDAFRTALNKKCAKRDSSTLQLRIESDRAAIGDIARHLPNDAHASKSARSCAIW
jgi:hypothetical protein